MWSVFKAERFSAADILRRISTVYGPKVMKEGVSKQNPCNWVCSFKSDPTNICNEYWPLMASHSFLCHSFFSANFKWTNQLFAHKSISFHFHYLLLESLMLLTSLCDNILLAVLFTLTRINKPARSHYGFKKVTNRRPP